MKNDRIGLLMIVASLFVIAIVSGLILKHQIELHENESREHGVAITRILSNASYQELVPTDNSKSLMRSLINVQNNKNFAYGVVVGLAGQKLSEITSSGSIAPAATMPNEPFAWFGEHDVVSPGDGRAIREFFAPVMHDSQLAGFIRVGYYRNDSNMFTEQISSLGLMALPIFLLTTLSYFLLRREIKPLNQLSEKMNQATMSYGIQAGTFSSNQGMSDFIQRFDQFIQLMQARAKQMDKETAGSHTVTHLLSYKQEKAESALNSIPDAVIVIDNEGLPTFANQKIEPLLGVNRKVILGNPAQEWCHNKDVLAFFVRLKNTHAIKNSASMQYVSDDSTNKHISVVAFPLFSPRDQSTLFGMLVVFRDISKEVLARHAGTEFVSHVSHELKTPLNTLSTYSELLLDYKVLKETDRVNAVNVIYGEVQRMSNLINNLLNISKMETGTLQLSRKRVKMHDLLQDAFDSISNHAHGKGITLELFVSPEIGAVRLDKDMFRIAIDNLLSNAIKYSDPNSKITVRAQIIDGNQIQISVRDQGIGISAEDSEKIFAKYYRASNAETVSRSGHGLGLYLAKQIIELHHGAITVQSELGKGTEFIVTFKAQSVQLEETATL